MSVSFSIPRGVLPALSVFSSKDETRYVLCGVHLQVINEKEIILTATDGRRLLTIKVPVEIAGFKSPFATIIPNRISKILMPKSSLDPVLTIGDKSEGGIVKISLSDALGEVTYSQKEIAGLYPRYSNVIPKEVKPAVGVQLNFEMYGDLKRVFKLLGGNDISGAALYREKEDGAIYIETAFEAFGLVCIIMQMRIREATHAKITIPEWATINIHAPKEDKK